MSFVHLFNDIVSVVDIFLAANTVARLSLVAGRYMLVRNLSCCI